jgi:hypothetical protein
MTGWHGSPSIVGWGTDAWSAIGLWATIVVYLALAVFAWRQLHEARTLRIQEGRAYVIAEFRNRSNLVYLAFRSIGRTSAFNVRISLDTELVSSRSEDGLAWQHSAAFTSGVPSMAPGAELRFFLDMFAVRKEAGLPMQIAGRLSYDDVLKSHHEESFLIDLDVYGPALQEAKGVADIYTEVKSMREEFEKWSDGNSGLLVNTVDRRRWKIRTDRSMHLTMARDAARKHGWRAALKHYIHLWRRRGGWQFWD